MVVEKVKKRNEGAMISDNAFRRYSTGKNRRCHHFCEGRNPENLFTWKRKGLQNLRPKNQPAPL